MSIAIYFMDFSTVLHLPAPLPLGPQLAHRDAAIRLLPASYGADSEQSLVRMIEAICSGTLYARTKVSNTVEQKPQKRLQHSALEIVRRATATSLPRPTHLISISLPRCLQNSLEQREAAESQRICRTFDVCARMRPILRLQAMMNSGLVPRKKSIQRPGRHRHKLCVLYRQ